jgi:16S rRNA (cytosine967-C5)-methyltransferase
LSASTARASRQPRTARGVAVRALLLWQEGASEFVDDALTRPELALQDERDGALARELSLGALRFGLLYDHLCDAYLNRSRQPVQLRAVLRIGCHQLLALDRIPPHAAVAESVAVLREIGQGALTGVANAVLRRISTARLEVRTAPGPLGRLPESLHPADPSLRHSLPTLLIEHLRPLLDQVPTRSLAALNEAPPLCTRTRPGKPQPQGAGILRRDGPWTWWSDPQEALRCVVEEQLCVVQDRAQGEVVAVARPRPHEWVLDGCAAPGGKSTAFIDAGCRVISADLHAEKVARMSEPKARLVQNLSRGALAPIFDLVVADVPCSNSGVLARRPEARWRYQAPILERLGRLQRQILLGASRLVAGDGRLVYATCSLAPQENQAVSHTLRGWKVIGEQLSWPDAWQSGGYAALLVRC